MDSIIKTIDRKLADIEIALLRGQTNKKFNDEAIEKIIKLRKDLKNNSKESKFEKLIELGAKQCMECSICGKKFEGYGNNALPVNNGRCCDLCNENVVVPVRIFHHFKQNESKGE